MVSEDVVTRLGLTVGKVVKFVDEVYVPLRAIKTWRELRNQQVAIQVYRIILIKLVYRGWVTLQLDKSYRVL